MSVVYCKPIAADRWAEDFSAGMGWLIKTTSKYDDPIAFAGALMADGDLPNIGTGHPLNPYLRRAPGMKIVPWNDSLFHWHATADYKIAFSEKEKEEEDRANYPSPLDRPAVVDKGYDRSTKAISRDRDGNAILNAAGDPYLDPVVVPRSSPRWNVTVYLASAPTWMDAFADKTNSDSITIRGQTFAAGELLFEPGPVSTQKEENGVSFCEASYSLVVNKDGWKERRFQNGLNELIVEGDAWVKRKIKLPTHDEDGNELEYDDELREYVSDPQMLDGSGKLLTNPKPETAVEHVIENYEQTAFGSLPGLG